MLVIDGFVVFPERLEKELYGLLPTSLSSGVRVLPPPYGTDSAWFGAKLVSNVSSTYLAIFRQVSCLGLTLLHYISLQYSSF